MTADPSGSSTWNRLALGFSMVLSACSVGPGTDQTLSTPDPGPSAGSNAGGTPSASGAGATSAGAGGSTAGSSAVGGTGAETGGAGGAATAGDSGSSGAAGGPPVQQGPFEVLAFTKTTGFRHDSIPAGLELLSQLGMEHDFTVTNAEDGADFTDENLAKYAVVVFMNASGDLLDETQQGAFERYIQGGGGYVGVHCASCAEDDWAWYGDLVGARFSGHPAIQEVTIKVENHTHPSTAELPDVWVRDEEPYNFEMNPRANVTVLATFDESTYQGGTMGADHPIAWYHEFQGGRSWYTGLGHISQGYMEDNFVKLIRGGVLWAARRAP
jgi:cytochrome c